MARRRETWLRLVWGFLMIRLIVEEIIMPFIAILYRVVLALPTLCLLSVMLATVLGVNYLRTVKNRAVNLATSTVILIVMTASTLSVLMEGEYIFAILFTPTLLLLTSDIVFAVFQILSPAKET